MREDLDVALEVMHSKGCEPAQVYNGTLLKGRDHATGIL